MRHVLAAALLAAAAVTAATVTASRVVAQDPIFQVTFGGGGDVGLYRQGNKLVFPRTAVRHWHARLPVSPLPGSNAGTAAMLRTALWSPADFDVRWGAYHGAYRVTLHFVETWATRPGQRVFGVSVGVQEAGPLPRVEEALDLFVAAGGKAYKPVDVVVDVTVKPFTEQRIVVRLHKMAANYPCISGMTVHGIASKPSL